MKIEQDIFQVVSQRTENPKHVPLSLCLRVSFISKDIQTYELDNFRLHFRLLGTQLAIRVKNIYVIYFQFSSVTQYCYLKAHNRTPQSSLQLFFFTNLFLNKILSPDIFFVSPLTFSFRSFAVPGSIISPLSSSNPLTSSLEKNGKHIVTKGIQTF